MGVYFIAKGVWMASFLGEAEYAIQYLDKIVSSWGTRMSAVPQAMTQRPTQADQLGDRRSLILFFLQVRRRRL